MEMRRTAIVAALIALALAGALALAEAPGSRPPFPEKPRKRASDDFARVWFDGKAELSGYEALVPRYGELRRAELVTIYVTEPLDRRTWIKDDDAKEPDRVTVLKLNESLKFLTGLYPYSVLTSVFAPVDDWQGERFSPVKLSLSAQEWCGHVFCALWPGKEGFLLHVDSYFASEGERTETLPAPEGALYEDALLIQLRELDGPFAGGGDWSGALIPALWRIRRAHQPAKAVPATIKRTSEGEETRFVLDAGDYRRTFLVEKAPPRRVLAWTSSDGEAVKLAKTERLAYWKMNAPGNEARRAEIGLPALPAPEKIEPPEGTKRVGF